MIFEPDSIVEINDGNQLMPPDQALINAGEGSYMVGGPGMDWDKFYDRLETEGFDMQSLGGKLDAKIQRWVRKAIRNGEIA